MAGCDRWKRHGLQFASMVIPHVAPVPARMPAVSVQQTVPGGGEGGAAVRLPCDGACGVHVIGYRERSVGGARVNNKSRGQGCLIGCFFTF